MQGSAETSAASGSSLKRDAPPSEDGSDAGSSEREFKRRRVTDKQGKYALNAIKFPAAAHYGGDIDEELAKAKLFWESTTSGVDPQRLEPEFWSASMVRPCPLQTTDLALTRVLGHGGFGVVAAASIKKRKRAAHAMDIEDGQLAIKIFHKRKLREREPEDERDFQNRMQDEKNVERANLRMIPWHPFIAGMYDCLADTRNLYLLQELGHCGTLAQRIHAHTRSRSRSPHDVGGGFPPDVCRFYFTNIVFALEYIQSFAFVHGDVKPDNFFVGADGYLMLGDFGLASRWDEVRDWGVIATMPYMSPEFARLQIDGVAKRALDWWGAGCILYEMATGRMAFPAKRGNSEGGDTQKVEYELTERVIRGQYFWPKDVEVDPDLKDLVDKMLRYQPSKRCGAWINGKKDRSVNAEIRNHPFMKCVNWKEVEDRTLLAPYVPVTIPDLSAEWHPRQMLPQRKVPGLFINAPEPHLDWDRRFRSQRDLAWQARQRAKQQAERVAQLGVTEGSDGGAKRKSPSEEGEGEPRDAKRQKSAREGEGDSRPAKRKSPAEEREGDAKRKRSSKEDEENPVPAKRKNPSEVGEGNPGPTKRKSSSQESEADPTNAKRKKSSEKSEANPGPAKRKNPSEKGKERDRKGKGKERAVW